jgi:hypothetical protein
MGYCFEMTRVRAVSHAAKVVEFLAFRDRTVDSLIGNHMHQLISSPFREVRPSIAALESPDPKPTIPPRSVSRCLVDESFESGFQGFCARRVSACPGAESQRLWCAQAKWAFAQFATSVTIAVRQRLAPFLSHIGLLARREPHKQLPLLYAFPWR